jgi:hypothetical protein
MKREIETFSWNGYHDYNVKINHVLSMSNKNIGFAENLTANKLASKLRFSCIKI